MKLIKKRYARGKNPNSRNGFEFKKGHKGYKSNLGKSLSLETKEKMETKHDEGECPKDCHFTLSGHTILKTTLAYPCHCKCHQFKKTK